MDTNNYYQIAEQASKSIGNHLGLKQLQSLAASADRVLDVGCGEGSRLNTILTKDKIGYGIDISRQAISQAKKKYPRHKFVVGLGEKLPFADNRFDLVYSAFAIEHCQNPTRFVTEMIRVCAAGGKILWLCPNYGAPNRRSPNSIQNPLAKFLLGLMADFSFRSKLSWQRVIPKKTYAHIDDDTTFEPYVLSLARFLKTQPVKIETCSSLWQLEGKSFNPRKLVLANLGKLGAFPISFWGPQLFVEVEKSFQVKYVGHQMLEEVSQMNNYHRWIVKHFSKFYGSRALEVGSGLGSLSKQILTYTNLTMTDIDQTYVDKLKKLGRAIRWDLQKSPPRSLTRQPFDSVFSSNVLEHVEHDRKALVNMGKVLKKGGYLLLYVPAMQSLYGKVDIGLNHHRRYEKSGLTQLLSETGYEVVTAKYVNLFGVLTWWLMGKVLRLEHPLVTGSLAKLVDSPLAAILKFEQNFELPIGQNLAVVARKLS